MIFDASRPGGRPGDSTFSETGRPIAVSVWYPVQQEAALGAGSAVYSLDPYHEKLAPISSLAFEAQGIDPAYEAPFLRPATGRLPVVIISPGAIFPDLGHVSFGTRLASHGFVVVVPYHFGMQWWQWESEVDHLAVLGWDRPRDISFLLDDLLRRNQSEGDLFYHSINPDGVFAGGWSLGGYAAITLASGDDSVCDTFYGTWYTDPPAWTCAPAKPDPRFKGLVLFDAASQMLHFSELQRVTVPSIALGETWDALAANGLASWQARQHAAMQGRPNYRVDIRGTVHYSFSDECEYARIMKLAGIGAAQGEGGWSWDDVLAWDCGPALTPSATVHRLMTGYAIAFLKTQLKVPGYRRMLTPDWALGHEPDVQFFTRERCKPAVPTPDWPPDYIYYQQQPAPDAEDEDACSGIE
jgi:dienelactone hydrolase